MWTDEEASQHSCSGTQDIKALRQLWSQNPVEAREMWYTPQWLLKAPVGRDTHNFPSHFIVQRKTWFQNMVWKCGLTIHINRWWMSLTTATWYVISHLASHSFVYGPTWSSKRRTTSHPRLLSVPRGIINCNWWWSMRKKKGRRSSSSGKCWGFHLGAVVVPFEA